MTNDQTHNDGVKTQFMQLLQRAITSEASSALHRTVEADPRLSILMWFELLIQISCQHLDYYSLFQNI